MCDDQKSAPALAAVAPVHAAAVEDVAAAVAADA